MDSDNEKFALITADNYICFADGKGGLPVINIKNKYATASISLQGAHILSWIPEGEDEVIWLSQEAKFAPGKSVRGGIPICWPWLGAHETNSDFPAHGFARTTNWKLLCTGQLEDQRTRITFTLEPQAGNSEMWPPATSLQYQVTVGEKLEMELVTCNNGVAPVTIGQALHTYFKVGDVSKVLLHGLEDTHYLDKLEGFKMKYQIGPVDIEKEVDRIYINTVGECVINDKVLKRNIVINKCGSHTTVVWNPWQETAEKMGDLGEQGYKKMLCVESCNAGNDVVEILPGKAHHLWVQYQVQKH